MIILDGTKLKIEKPSGLLSQSQWYSDYKSSTTLKAQVGVDPRGSLIFILMLFSESISDKKITNDSGFFFFFLTLETIGSKMPVKLKKGDFLMVDMGLSIKEENRAPWTCPSYFSLCTWQWSDVSKGNIFLQKRLPHIECM